jgi:plastocyanin
METSPSTPPKKIEYRHIAVLVLIVLAIGAAIGLAGAGVYAVVTGSNVFALPSSATTGTGQIVNVSIPNGVGTNQSLNYMPANVTLARGGAVKWTNNDPTPHTSTSTSVPSGAQGFDSKNMAQGSTYSYTFTVSGTYQYICAYHPWMHGTVIVNG